MAAAAAAGLYVSTLKEEWRKGISSHSLNLDIDPMASKYTIDYKGSAKRRGGKTDRRPRDLWSKVNTPFFLAHSMVVAKLFKQHEKLGLLGVKWKKKKRIKSKRKNEKRKYTVYIVAVLWARLISVDIEKHTPTMKSLLCIVRGKLSRWIALALFSAY